MYLFRGGAHSHSLAPVVSVAASMAVHAAKCCAPAGCAEGLEHPDTSATIRSRKWPTPHARCASTAAHRLQGSYNEFEIEKPLTDYREYRYARLPNNLQAVLISDPKCDRAAAALSVKVGSLYDPANIQGLAHFCEHMLFLGTKKYPQENEYNEYLAKNGGGSNAYTAESVTNYFFSVKPEALEGALDRFAQFFISPLFTESATERELQAVDSEHSKNLQQDGWRQSQLLRAAVDPKHPLHHFMTGNSQTLRDIPLQEGIDVRSALLDFHAKYYSANLMQLVVVGSESPQDLLTMAQSIFSPIVNTHAQVPLDHEIGNETEAFPPERRARLVRVVPVQDVRGASFQFVSPGQKEYWRSKPSHYIAQLIGHEGSGSLLAALKCRGFATELSAGSSLDEAGVHIFSISVVLTELGERSIQAVGDLVFAYLHMLRKTGPEQWRWNELQRLSEMGFRFRSLSDSLSTASSLAHNLQEYPPECALSASVRLWDYEPKLITDLLNMLTCDNLRLVLSGKSYATECKSKEPWYGTEYSDDPIPSEFRAHWASAQEFTDLTLPQPNPFVPENLSMLPPEGKEHPPVPRPLSIDFELPGVQAGRIVTAFFRKDEVFQLPKAVCAFQMYCPFAAESITTRLLSELWCMAVREELNEFAYEAQVAGLSYSLQANATGMTFSVGGYSDKLPVLLQAVGRKMSDLTCISEQTFSIIRTILERNLVNATATSSPYQQAFMHEQCLMQQPASTWQARLDALQGITSCQDLNSINRKLLNSCHVECLLQGNITNQQAGELVRSFMEPLGICNLLDHLPAIGTAKLPPGWTIIEHQGSNPLERNGALLVTLQADEYSLRSRCLVDITSQVLGQRFFDELRTKQQLGYIVSASACGERHGFVGLRFIVQSEKPSAQVLLRVQEWLRDQWVFLSEELSKEQFDQYRAALVARLRERSKSLNEEFGRNWSEVSSRGFAFDYREEEAACLEAITLEDVQVFTKDKLQQASASCVKIAAQGGQPDLQETLPIETVVIDRRLTAQDVERFRACAEWRFRNSAIELASSPEPPLQLRARM